MRSIPEIEQELRAARDEQNRAYWIFTRTARGKPVSPEITRKIVQLETELSNAKFGHNQ